MTVIKTMLWIILGVPVFAVLWHTAVRILRYFYKFPMPQFMANVIDNPLRRRIQPPDEMPLRHHIQPGMTVLDVGPGNGRYTTAAAQWVGRNGKVIAIDIESKMIERVTQRALEEGVTNLEARIADVYDLPFDDGFFDAVYMITVISEIPDPKKAMREFYRVLAPSGVLAFSELFLDPDYPLAGTLIRLAGNAGFSLKERQGSFFSYTLVFEKR